MPIGSLTAAPIATGVGKIVRQMRSSPNAGSAAPGNGAVAQVTTVTFASVSSSSPYSIIVTDPYTGVTETASITTDGSASDAEASALLLAAVEAKPMISGFFSAADDGAGVVTLTARTAGLAITVAEGVDTGAKMTIATPTAAAAATEYTFGKAVEVYFDGGIRKARIPVQPTRGTFTFTLTHAASSSYSQIVNVRNVATGGNAALSVYFASGANVTATGANAVTAWGAVNTLGTGLITAAAATAGSADGTITVALPTGWTFASASTPVVITGGAAASTTPAVGAAGGTVPDLAIVYDPGDDSSDTLGTGSRTTIRGGTVVPFILNGAAILVNPAVAPTVGQAVLVDFASTGALTPTASVTTAPLVVAGSAWKFTGESQVIGASTYYVCEAA